MHQHLGGGFDTRFTKSLAEERIHVTLAPERDSLPQVTDTLDEFCGGCIIDTNFLILFILGNQNRTDSSGLAIEHHHNLSNRRQAGKGILGDGGAQHRINLIFHDWLRRDLNAQGEGTEAKCRT